MTRLAIEKNRITYAALLLLILSGIGAYRSLPQAEDPSFVIRTAAVITQFPGASPERVENLVTDKIEEVVQEIPELDVVRSESRTGVSVIYVDIQQRYTRMRPIWDDLRRKVDAVRPDLPAGVVGPIVNDEFGDVFGILLTLTGEGYDDAELKDVADEARDVLLGLPEAAKVEIYGAQEERIFVEYDNARLAELGLSVYQLQQILESQNIVTPGGSVRIGDERVALEPSGSFEQIEDLRRTVIRLPGRSDLLFLGDLALVRRGTIDPPRTKVRATGEAGLALGVSLRDGGNILSLGEQVATAIRDLERTFPYGIEFTRVADQPERVEKKVKEFVGNLAQAVLIILLVMLVTLGVRTGLVVAALIPTAILLTLIVMSVTGVGLDQMTLASLIIALGMLIDNAIVMSESIMVQMRSGRPALQAAVDSGRELRVPLLTSSLTTSAAFLPFYLAKSETGEYTGVIFTVVTITLIGSWLLALTMTPLLCVKFLRVREQESRGTAFDSTFYRLYRRGLVALLRRRWTTVMATLALFVGAMSLFQFVPVLFFPKADRSFFTATIDLPSGTDIGVTEDVVRRIEEYVATELPGVTTWSSFVGGGEPRYILNSSPEEAKPSHAFMLINTESAEAVADAVERLHQHCERTFPDVVASIRPSEYGPPVIKPIQVRISGREADELFAIVDRVEHRIREIPGTRNVQDDWGRRTRKLLIAVNQPRAHRAGVSSLDIAVSLQSLVTGVVTTEFREKSAVIPVVLRSEEAERLDLGKLDTLNVYSQATGRNVPLKQVADVRVAWEPAKIKRRDRAKTVTVEAELLPGVTATDVNAQLVPWLDGERASWPRGYRYELGGEIESSGEANASIGEQLPIAGLIIALLLVGQFNSFRKPLIVVSVIPLGVIGVVIGLLAFRSFFGFMTLLGIVSLAGIVINNAIVLLDRIQIEIDGGLDPPRAVVEAAQRRLRPILLTTTTTIGGLLPLYLFGGAMWEPMAVAIMSGLAFATLLTLGFVPVLYSLLYGVRFEGLRP